MIVTCNRIPVNPAHAAAFEERFANRASQVDRRPAIVKLIRRSCHDRYLQSNPRQPGTRRSF